MNSRMIQVLTLSLTMLLLTTCEKQYDIQDTILPVRATLETSAVPVADDTADDPCIWIHPTDPALSTIIGTNKISR